jgi:hypothetical protein
MVPLFSHLSPAKPVVHMHTYLVPFGGFESSQVPEFIQGFGLQGVFIPENIHKKIFKNTMWSNPKEQKLTLYDLSSLLVFMLDRCSITSCTCLVSFL